jgi:hypothetical protein
MQARLSLGDYKRLALLNPWTLAIESTEEYQYEQRTGEHMLRKPLRPSSAKVQKQGREPLDGGERCLPFIASEPWIVGMPDDLIFLESLVAHFRTRIQRLDHVEQHSQAEGITLSLDEH